MTPEEILRDLRDIHLPDDLVTSTGAGIVLWPLAIIVAITASLAWIAWRRRSSWRLQIARHLDAIEQGASDGHVLQSWTDLAVLLRRIAMQLSDRRDIAGLIGDDWLVRLDHLFDTDLFSAGPGRGVAVFPYTGHTELDGDERRRITDQLKKTIDDVRKRLPHLRASR